MTGAEFPPHIVNALNRLTVPPLPTGFHARLAARLESGALPNDTPPLPAVPVRRARGSSWRRPGRILAVVASFGLATATAAASGVFGDPVYVPVVSDVLAKTKLVTLPKERASTHTPTKAVQTPLNANETLTARSTIGKNAVLELLSGLPDNAEFKALSRRDRAHFARAEIMKLIEAGVVTRADIKAAMAQLQREKTARAGENTRHDPAALKPRQRIDRSSDADKPRQLLSPAKKQKLRAARDQLSPEQQTELRLLRQKLRAARREDRRAIRAEIRAFWQRSGIKPTQDETDIFENGDPAKVP